MQRFSGILSLVLVLLTAMARAEVAPPSDRVLLILIPGLTLSQANRMPVIAGVMLKGSSALMSSRVGRSADIPDQNIIPDPLTSGYLTLSCGARAAGGFESGAIMRPDELMSINGAASLTSAGKAWAEFHAHPAPLTGLVAPLYELTRNLSATARYEIPFGALATHLRQAKIASDVIGNADTPEDYHREAALFVTDATGVAKNGHVSEEFSGQDARYAFGRRTNLAMMREYLMRARSSRFVVVETGDPARYIRYSTYATPAAKSSMQQLAYQSADEVVELALKSLPRNTRLVIASPGVIADPDLPEANDLQLIVSYTKGQHPGLLYSGATHREGVVSNTDLASAITYWLGVPRIIGSGSALEDRPVLNPTGQLQRLDMIARYQAASQGTVYVLVYTSLAAILLGLLATFVRQNSRFLALALFPPAAFTTLLAVTPLYLPAVAVAALCISVGLIAAWLSFERRQIRGEYLAGVSTLICLMAIPFKWYEGAAASYQIAGGARYYGVGNEYSGLLQGAFFFIAAANIPRMSRWLGLTCFLVLACIIGHPGIGANAGDMLGGLIAVLVGASILSGHRGRRWMLFGLVAAILLVAVFGVIDASRPAGRQSHIGRAVVEIADSGPKAAVEIIARKLELNLMLVRSSPWFLLFVAQCVGTLVLFITLWRQRVRVNLVRIQGLAALVIGLFILNDSGVLSGATAGVWLFLAISQEYCLTNNTIKAK